MCVCAFVKLTEMLLHQAEAVFKDYCRGGKEAINLCLQNGIQLSFKAFRIFWKMISFCLLISTRGCMEAVVQISKQACVNVHVGYFKGLVSLFFF